MTDWLVAGHIDTFIRPGCRSGWLSQSRLAVWADFGQKRAGVAKIGHPLNGSIRLTNFTVVDGNEMTFES